MKMIVGIFKTILFAYLVVCAFATLCLLKTNDKGVVEFGSTSLVVMDNQVLDYYKKGDLVIVKNETLSFDSSNIAEYSDDRITSATTAMIYYKDPSIARTAAIASETTTGKIVFTAASAPSSDVVCDIIFIKN